MEKKEGMGGFEDQKSFPVGAEASASSEERRISSSSFMQTSPAVMLHVPRLLCPCQDCKRVFSSDSGSYPQAFGGMYSESLFSDESRLPSLPFSGHFEGQASTIIQHEASQQPQHMNEYQEKELISFIKYKTVLCNNYENNCTYGHRCKYAHSFDELRCVKNNVYYRKFFCNSLKRNGYCKYGKKCIFYHKPSIDFGSDGECSRRSSISD